MHLDRDLWILKLPLRATLESIGNPKYSLFIEAFANNLKTDGHPAVGLEAARWNRAQMTASSKQIGLW
jgi:hypothetical protein